MRNRHATLLPREGTTDWLSQPEIQLSCGTLPCPFCCHCQVAMNAATWLGPGYDLSTLALHHASLTDLTNFSFRRSHITIDFSRYSPLLTTFSFVWDPDYKLNSMGSTIDIGSLTATYSTLVVLPDPNNQSQRSHNGVAVPQRQQLRMWGWRQTRRGKKSRLK